MILCLENIDNEIIVETSFGGGSSDWCYHTQEEERHYLYDGDAPQSKPAIKSFQLEDSRYNCFYQ